MHGSSYFVAKDPTFVGTITGSWNCSMKEQKLNKTNNQFVLTTKGNVWIFSNSQLPNKFRAVRQLTDRGK